MSPFDSRENLNLFARTYCQSTRRNPKIDPALAAHRTAAPSRPRSYNLKGKLLSRCALGVHNVRSLSEETQLCNRQAYKINARGCAGKCSRDANWKICPARKCARLVPYTNTCASAHIHTPISQRTLLLFATLFSSRSVEKSFFKQNVLSTRPRIFLTATRERRNHFVE